ncbi:UDP-glucuronosyltransferase 2C1 [Poecilia reticulata]|uniref:UDP-glucuronosyltransferase 2C1 n=1 Tax=Poecilia reticulata TaxID=8081 RepID=UPI0004A24021|nr:PREDICTED: UDP-glucuronosyltransferase 2C1 [Poecilia reticulata]XP_017158802.1 PREDICTED: UDP-glucuronosyltransferase 2C1 [Poecilia reticulata]
MKFPSPLTLLPSFLLLGVFFPAADSGHFLAFPGEYSHWLNMRTIIEELVRRNHKVTVLVPDASPSVNYNSSQDAAKYNFLVFKVPFSRSDMNNIMQDFIQFSMYKAHNSSLLDRFLVPLTILGKLSQIGKQQCDAMLKNQQLMATLRDAAFDVVILDPMVMCGDLVAEVLGLPLVLSLRFSFGSTMERHCGQAPMPASFIPASPLPYSDHMTFRERLVNMLTYTGTSVLSELYWRTTVDSFYTDIKGSPTSFCSSLGRADVWLIRTFWDIETPRPIPPNFFYVGGLHCRPAHPLPEDLEAFVQSSGDAGIVVVTFGSMVTNLAPDRANVIASALGRLPQKVIWRYRGKTPATLSPNTKILHWIPQNDLLGHQLTRAFVTHGGTNGLYEALFHGVPVVGIPLFGDQPDNLARLSRRGAAVVLHFNHMTVDELVQALHAVINEPSFRSNMQQLSSLQHQQPVAPLNTAAFWLEFVLRHGGAKHLRLASHDLYWFQYYSLDTGVTILFIIAVGSALCWVGLRCVLRHCKGRARREKND